MTHYADPDPERVIGIWRQSMAAPGFWFRVVITITLYYWIFWQRNQIVLTNRRITQYKANLIGGSETSITIGNITEVNVHTPPIGALFGYADVRIKSKGGDKPDIEFKAMERPEELKQRIFALQDRAQRERQG